MIQANELKLNNLVTVDGILGKVDWIQKESISVTYLERQENLVNGIITHEEKLEPIPLTPEILEKCGFEKKERYYYHKSLPNCYRIIISEGCYMSNIIPEIKSLNQLQNLYYALTGEELNFKL